MSKYKDVNYTIHDCINMIFSKKKSGIQITNYDRYKMEDMRNTLKQDARDLRSIIQSNHTGHHTFELYT